MTRMTFKKRNRMEMNKTEEKKKRKKEKYFCRLVLLFFAVDLYTLRNLIDVCPNK